MAVTGSDDGETRPKAEVKAAVARLRGDYKALIERLRREGYGELR